MATRTIKARDLRAGDRLKRGSKFVTVSVITPKVGVYADGYDTVYGLDSPVDIEDPSITITIPRSLAERLDPGVIATMADIRRMRRIIMEAL